MKEYILDVNIIFSALISGKDFYNKIFSNFKFYVPDFALLEIVEYEKIILEKTKLDIEKLKEFSIVLFSKFIIIPKFLIPERTIKRAFELCKDIDEKDTMYIALSIELGHPLITRDKKLFKGLKKNNFNNLILFDDFLYKHFPPVSKAEV